MAFYWNLVTFFDYLANTLEFRIQQVVLAICIYTVTSVLRENKYDFTWNVTLVLLYMLLSNLPIFSNALPGADFFIPLSAWTVHQYLSPGVISPTMVDVWFAGTRIFLKCFFEYYFDRTHGDDLKEPLVKQMWFSNKFHVRSAAFFINFENYRSKGTFLKGLKRLMQISFPSQLQ